MTTVDIGPELEPDAALAEVLAQECARIAVPGCEQAIRDLRLDPMGLSSTFFFPNEIMTRRFAVGHNMNPDDGTVSIARPWAMARGNAPAGGLSANARDQIAWARFHLGDGKADDGTQLLSAETIKRMEPIRLPESELAAYVGRFETIAAVVDITATDGRLSAVVTIKPETAAMLRESGEAVPDEQPPISLALLKGKPDAYMVDEGPAKGMKGYFQRGADGTVEGVHLGGRLATRVSTPV